MTSSTDPFDRAELEKLAVAAELGRQLAHDCGNFVYNVLLQIEILERRSGGGAGTDWAGVKSEAKALSRRLKDWQSFDHGPDEDFQDVELNRVVGSVVQELQAENKAARFAPFLALEPLWFHSNPGSVKRFCRLLLNNLMTVDAAELSVATEKSDGIVVLRVGNIEPVTSNLHWLESKGDIRPDLFAATCRAMAMRLGANLTASQDPPGKINIITEFPVVQT